MTAADRLVSAFISCIGVAAFLVVLFLLAGFASMRRDWTEPYILHHFAYWAPATCFVAFILGFILGPDRLAGVTGILFNTDNTSSKNIAGFYFMSLMLSAALFWYLFNRVWV